MPTPTLSAADAELLKVLDAAFAQHAGKDGRLDLDDLRRALGLRSDYLTRRIFDAFDRNHDGIIQKEEFLAGVRALVLGSPREKLAFAFRLWDHDGDGLLSREELLRMISLSLAESDVEERLNQPAEQLASMLLAKADRDKDGRLSFDELAQAAERFPDLLARMTRNEAIWIAPNEELLLLLDERAGGPGRHSPRGLYRVPQLAFLGLWLLANVAVFAWSMVFGRASLTTDPAMQVGRGLGACIDLDVAFVVLPVMRRLLTWLRPRWVGRLVPINEAIDFHKMVGHTLFALSLAHAGTFLFAYLNGHAAAAPWEILGTSRGGTGAALLGIFIVIWVFSLGFIRRSKRFELFYFTHLLYVAWIALVVAHGPRILLFSGFAIVAFVVEHLLRLRRRRPPSRVASATPLRSGVTQLEIERPPGFDFNPGDYVFLRIPAIARREWHPFTISSAPESSRLGFHVRSLGNWTAALRRSVEEGGRQPMAVFVDGPYGSPSAHIFRSRFAVLIGAGIGVTPFASVLESVVLRSNRARPSSLEKVHFFWLNRDQYSFEWFRGLLSSLEQQDAGRLLDIHLCMTSVRSGVSAFGLELAREVMRSAGRSDFITGLRTTTHLGQPDWGALLGAIAERHRPAPVDVFFCGPHGLARKLEPICDRLGMRFREEQF